MMREDVRDGSGAVGPEASEPGSPCIDAPMLTGMGTQREVTRVAAVSHPSPEISKPPSDICPWEADFPTFTVPCRYPRGHAGRHSYLELNPDVDAGPLCDECGLIVCVCTANCENREG